MKTDPDNYVISVAQIYKGNTVLCKSGSLQSQKHVTLTRTMPELKTEVRTTEPVYGNRQLDDFSPARAIAMIKDKGMIYTSAWLS